MATVYRVTAPYVTVLIDDVSGGAATTHGFYEGAVLPPTVNKKSAEGLVTKGMVEKLKMAAPEPEAEPKPAVEDGEPGSLADTLKKQAADAGAKTPEPATKTEPAKKAAAKPAGKDS